VRAAASEPRRAWLDYRPVEGCPGEYTFRAQVQARTAKLILSPTPANGAASDQGVYEVRLRRDPGGYSGALEVKLPHATPTHNELSGPTCDEVVAGLAIAAALGVEVEEIPVLPKPPADQPPTAETQPLAPSAAVSQSADRDREDRGWLLALSPAERFGYGPSAAPGLGMWIGHRTRSLGWQAQVAAARGGDVEPSNVNLAFWWLAAEAELCLEVPPASQGLRILACGSLEAGIVRGMASTDETSTRPWVAPGVVLRLHAPLGRFFFEPTFGVRAPLIRDRYWIRPAVEAFRVPAATGEASLAVGFHFE
jgi:hypothetical protein